jgi:hypothetical protein
MSKTTTQSRRHRRAQFRAMGYLKIKNMYGRFSPQGIAWYNKMREDGMAAHDANVNRNLDNVESQLQVKLNALKETWASIGYNESEIAMLEEAWIQTAVKNKETYREDTKLARKLMKEAKESLKSRLNANS